METWAQSNFVAIDSATADLPTWDDPPMRMTFKLGFLQSTILMVDIT